MVYTISDSFKEILSDRLEQVTFSKFRVGNMSVGYYEFKSIFDGDDLHLNLEIPQYGTGIEGYKEINLYYDTLSNPSDIVSGIRLYNSDSSVLGLGRKNHVILKDFKPKAFMILSNSSDNSFLEGIGLLDYKNIYSSHSMDDFISVSSFNSYYTENLVESEKDKQNTVYINKFGLKIY